jgi:hypothetical protein
MLPFGLQINIVNAVHAAIRSTGGNTSTLAPAEARKRKGALQKFIPKPPPISRNPRPRVLFLRCRRRKNKLSVIEPDSIWGIAEP